MARWQHIEWRFIIKRLCYFPSYDVRFSGVVAVLRGQRRMLSANFGRSQGIRRMFSASPSKNKLPFISSEIWNKNWHFCHFRPTSASERYGVCMSFWNHWYLIYHVVHAYVFNTRADLLMSLPGYNYGWTHAICFWYHYFTGRIIIIMICLFRTRGTQYIPKDATEQPGATK